MVVVVIVSHSMIVVMLVEQGQRLAQWSSVVEEWELLLMTGSMKNSIGQRVMARRRTMSPFSWLHTFDDG